MLEMSKIVADALEASTEVVALIPGTKIYPLKVPSKPMVPYLRYFIRENGRNYTKDGKREFEVVIEHYHRTYVEALGFEKHVEDALVTRLDTLPEAVKFSLEGKEPQLMEDLKGVYVQHIYTVKK